MAETKTRATAASVEDHLAAKASPAQRADCESLVALCQRVTNQPPTMWGPSIVGFGKYAYRYDSGHAGESCLVGFAVRGRDLVLYLSVEAPEQQARLASLGTHRMGKACLYFRRLADLDVDVLEALVVGSIAEVRARFPG